jgi:hypothetical protein
MAEMRSAHFGEGHLWARVKNHMELRAALIGLEGASADQRRSDELVNQYRANVLTPSLASAAPYRPLWTLAYGRPYTARYPLRCFF